MYCAHKKISLGERCAIVKFCFIISETSKKPPNFEISYRFWQLQIRFEESESWLRFAIVDHKASILYCGIKIFEIYFLYFAVMQGRFDPLTDFLL